MIDPKIKQNGEEMNASGTLDQLTPMYQYYSLIQFLHKDETDIMIFLMSFFLWFLPIPCPPLFWRG